MCETCLKTITSGRVLLRISHACMWSRDVGCCDSERMTSLQHPVDLWPISVSFTILASVIAISVVGCWCVTDQCVHFSFFSVNNVFQQQCTFA